MMLPPILPTQTQRWEGCFEPHSWEMSYPHGNGYGHTGFRKGRECTSGLAGVVGVGREQRCCVRPWQEMWDPGVFLQDISQKTCSVPSEELLV